jgi:tetratricopeptide (TPR) repeat protein
MIYDRLATLNLPAHNMFFTGRGAILETIARWFFSEIEATQTLALSGLAGVGKTQIALEYAHRYYDHYDAVLWVKASSKDTFESDMLIIARILDLPEMQDKDVQIIVAAVHRWLKQRRKWLLILDEVKDEQLLNGFVPSVQGGDVLITTQLSAISGIESIEVESMTESEGVQLLLRCARIIPPNSEDDDDLAARYPDALTITRLMAGLPLALDQAGAFIDATSCGLDGYLLRYEKQSAELLKWRVEAQSADDVSLSVRWLMLISDIESVPFALDILRFCAFLNAEDIPEELIHTGLRFFNPMATPDSPDVPAAIDVLCNYSLLRRSSNKDLSLVSIHRLMQEVLKGRLDKETQRRYAENTVLAVNEAFPEIDFSNWDKCHIYLPHMRICIQYIKTYQIFSKEAAHLIHEAAYYMFERVMYQEVETLYLDALLIQKNLLGPDDVEVARTLYSLALYWRELARYDEAEKLFQEALEIREKKLGGEHVHTAASLHQLGWIYNRLARYEEAEDLLLRALEIRRKQLPPLHQNVATSLNEIGRLYRHIAHYDKAHVYLDDALEIRMKLNHPHFAKTLVDLAWLYYEQGDLEEAGRQIIRALSTQEATLHHHPRLAKTLTKLGLLYCARGRFGAAEKLYQRALAIRQEILPQDHPDMAETYDSLGLLYYHQAQYDMSRGLDEEALEIYGKSEHYYQLALELRRKILGPIHPETTQTLNHLGLLYFARGEFEQAHRYFTEALEAREKTLGKIHPHIVSCLNNLAQLSIAQGNYAEAENLLLQARSICDDLHIQHPQIARTLESLGDLYVLLGRDEEAQALYEQVIPIYTSKLIPNHPNTVEVLKKRAELFRKKGDNISASQLEQPIETLIDVLKGRAIQLRKRGNDINASELEQRIATLQE